MPPAALPTGDALAWMREIAAAAAADAGPASLLLGGLLLIVWFASREGEWE